MRVRFAPSPTGSLHLGNARTALVNWMHARGAGGTLVLRIEDTDRNRNTPEAEAALMHDLRWLGLDWDEGPDVGGAHGPYRQSERTARYGEIVRRLLEQERAYRCFCDPVVLRERRDAARSAGQGYRYDGACRAIPPAEGERRVDAGEAAAVRFRGPDGACWPTFVDTLRGETGAGDELAEDFVIARADGSPLYQLAVVVDDHDMAIDHVIRGQDHLTNTVRQVSLYEALGWTVPAFTHLPLVLGEDRGRLSKRHGATSVADMRERGVLPEALMNYLALLGWAPPGEQEVLTPSELLDAWALDAMSPTNVTFDLDKLHWLHQAHLLAFPADELLRRATPTLRQAGLEPAEEGPEGEWWARAVDLVRGQAGGLEGLARELGPVFEPRIPRFDDPAERLLLERFGVLVTTEPELSPERFKECAREAGQAAGLKGRSLFHPLRVALTGAEAGPELARLVPLIHDGARLGLVPPVTGIGARLDRALGSEESGRE